MTWRKIARPNLPLCCGVDDDQEICTVYDVAGTQVFSAGEVAWLNRAATAYSAERPKLRRALREAIAEIEAGVGGPRDATEEEVALLVRLHRALGPMALRRFLNWRTKR